MFPAGRLFLNRRLIEAPVEAIDYVITHELCHMAELHHTVALLQASGARDARLGTAQATTRTVQGVISDHPAPGPSGPEFRFKSLNQSNYPGVDARSIEAKQLGIVSNLSQEVEFCQLLACTGDVFDTSS